MDINSLAIPIDTSDLTKLQVGLDKVVDAGGKAEDTANKTGRAWETALSGVAGDTQQIVKELQALNARQDATAQLMATIGRSFADYSQGASKAASAANDLAAAEAKVAETADQAKARIMALIQAGSSAADAQREQASAALGLSEAQQGIISAAAVAATAQNRAAIAQERNASSAGQLASATKLATAATAEEVEGLDKLLNKLNPTRKAQADLNADLSTLSAGFKAGKLDLDRYTAEVGKVNAQLRGLDGSGSFADKLSLGTKAARENFLQLGNAIAEGNFRIAAHNILEIGTNAGASALQFAALAAPVLAVAAALGLVAYGYAQGSKEQDEYNKQLILTGNYAGTSAGQLADVARQVSATVGTTGQAAVALAQLAGSGKIASGSFQEITEAALEMEKATGKSVDSTIAEFVKIADDPVAAAKSLNDQYHFLTASVYSQIVALKEQGDTIGATKLLTDTYAETVSSRAGEITKNLGLIERGWNAIKGAAAGALDATLNVGREQTLQQQIEQLQKRLGNESNYSALPIIGQDNPDLTKTGTTKEEDQSRLNFLLLQRDAEASRTKYVGDRAKIEQDSIAAIIKVDELTKSSYTNDQKRVEAIKEYKKWLDDIRKADPNDARLNQATIDKNIANINDRFKDQKGPANQLNLTGFNDQQNALKALVSDYSNSQKELEAQQKRGTLSQEDYYRQRVALLSAEKDQVNDTYDAEIKALEDVRDKSTTTGAQRIQINQKIDDARAEQLKAAKSYDSQMAVLADNEATRVEKQRTASEAYVAQLERQRAALESAGARAAGAIGLGDRQQDLQNSLDGVTDKFNDERAKLLDRRKTAPDKYSQDDYEKDLSSLGDAENKYRDTVLSNFDQMTAAQGDWRKGATSAYQSYLESAQNVAGQTKSLFTNAFSSMEDAVANFALTGKLSFSDFTKSILADLARIATRQASSALLSSLFGIGLSFFSGGGGNGLAPGSAGAVSSNLGASQAGYSSTFFPQAKGGAWLDGVQMFANGGAFANGIVSSPTAFGMAGGGTGVMGEAGPEAIVPLARTSSGALGIRSVGGGGSNIQINAPINIVTQDRSSEGMQLDQQALQQNLQQQMQAAAEKAVADSWRAGGVSYRNTNRRG